MSRKYIKHAFLRAESDHASVEATVREMLSMIEKGRDEAAIDYARKLDGWNGSLFVSDDELVEAELSLSSEIKNDLQFAHDNIRRFAELQKTSLRDCEIEIRPGLTAGQRSIPVHSAGCYVPGGRYCHIASAMMTITTAKVAGVREITACSLPRSESGIPPAVLFAMKLCGANRILNMGGVQAIAAMAYGLFGLPKADIIVGPGNQFVAEAKRLLFGRVGIDMVAGPTDSLIVADQTADPSVVAADLVGQAEHGANSPVWLVTDCANLANTVLALVPELIASLPEPNRSSAREAWKDYGEIVLVDSREEMAEAADAYAPEHLHVQADDLEWWISRLGAYGSLFLGEETTVAFGDKASGPNHVLPTSGAARYTGGLSVHKFLKTVTWQRASRSGIKDLARVTAHISRLEGMEGHARSADIRLRKYFHP